MIRIRTPRSNIYNQLLLKALILCNLSHSLCTRHARLLNITHLVYGLLKRLMVFYHIQIQAILQEESSTTAFDFNNECYCWSDETGTNRQLFLIHRLDSAASGLILLSHCIEMATQLREAFSNREIEKTYFAMVNYHGLPIRSHWQDFLGKHEWRQNT